MIVSQSAPMVAHTIVEARLWLPTERTGVCTGMLAAIYMPFVSNHPLLWYVIAASAPSSRATDRGSRLNLSHISSNSLYTVRMFLYSKNGTQDAVTVLLHSFLRS